MNTPTKEESALTTINEILNAQQRMKKKMQMKRLAPKIAIAKKRAMNHLASKDKLLDRAKKQARNILVQKLAKKPKSEMSAGEKASVEKKLIPMKGKIDMMAKKLFKDVKAQDIARMQNKGKTDK